MRILNTRPCTCENCGPKMPHFLIVSLNKVSCVKCACLHTPTPEEREQWPIVIPLMHGDRERRV